MKKFLFTLAVICGCLLLWGCAAFEEEVCIPAATVEQTAAVFNDVVARDKCDIVLCRLVKQEHANILPAKYTKQMYYKKVAQFL